MADDSVEAAVEYVPLAYLTPENHAAQRSLMLLADRHANLPNLIENNDQLPQSNRTAKAKHRFSLSIGNPGESFNGGWVLGKGDITYSVDLRLCPPSSRYLTGPLLGTIHIHPQSGVFLLQNNSRLASIEYIEAGIVLGYQETHILFLTRNHIRFGPLDYVFDINAESEADFSLARREYMRRNIYNSIANIENSALFHQLLEGLKNLHSMGIMHRDISPKNSLILSLGPKPRAAICDFGKSKIGTTGMSRSLGPPAFIAPEDQLYTSAMGNEGGYKTVLKELASLREQGQIPEELGALLRSMLSWDPVDRPTAAQALEHEAWKGIVSCDSRPQPQQGSEMSSESVSGSGSESGMKKRMRSREMKEDTEVRRTVSRLAAWI
ncbi:hypothetical protein VPNG_10350 [Cytospora leucostoma]|uniref:Protein kinase domain-containing protein n=1 Tax=Cytospora leucostoma TaxID=1230097 RepID=A0A423VAR6_9PEZI|nr:hypothetical protein VPNG_10350 [Cytospora leucostoma]